MVSLAFCAVQLFTEGAGRPPKFFDIPPDKFQQNVGLTVNGQPVTKYIKVNGVLVLEGSGGLYWKPSRNNDYVMVFTPKGRIDGDQAIDRHLRIQGFVLM